MNGALQQSNWLQFIRLDDQTLMAQCAVDCFRASGPGGQKRNKTDSAVRLRHPPPSVTVEAAESRSQHENRGRALRRVRAGMEPDLRRRLMSLTNRRWPLGGGSGLEGSRPIRPRAPRAWPEQHCFSLDPRRL